jgi:deoxyribonuclease IV
MKIGFHISISKGFEWTFREAERLTCDALQIFVKNPRSWIAKEWKDSEVEVFRRLSGNMPVFAHLSYLPNLAAIDEDERHMKAFLGELELCRQVGIRAMVVHCGSRENKRRGMEIVAEAVNRALDRYDLDIMLETAAGQGRSLGVSLPELATIYGQVERKEKVFLCLDTAHLFQSGYDFHTKVKWNGLVRSVEGLFGKDRIGLFHLNDSKTGLGSRVDRHWHIGEGQIGARPFSFILNDKRLAGLSGVMETPKTGTMDELNMKTMRSLLSPLVPGSFA